jgi:triacylglycerol esterase/lipase EstA (alpha/beta hydrolase family)
VTLPGDALGDIRVQANALATAANAAEQQAGATSVDVVAYSAGGVVAREWVRFDGGSTVARRIVTLGTPNHGTLLASLGNLFRTECPKACQQLATGSSFLDRLNGGGEVPAGPAWVSVWTSHDDVVLPAKSARLNGAMNLEIQSLCPSDSVDHTGLPTDPVVRQIVLAALGPAMRVPSPGC